jgi:glucose/arabinose dehydrogenase
MVARRLILFATCAALAIAQQEEDLYYKRITIPVPEAIKLEVSGLETLPDGRIAAATRKGEVWIIDNAYEEPPARVKFQRFAFGLHEPLGLAWRDNSLLAMQRTELTRLSDRDRDGEADVYETVAKGWGVTGNYHEYAYGPKLDGTGNMWVTLNSSIGARLNNEDQWRGWSLLIQPDGTWKPVSAGMRSPSGIGLNTAGDVFYTDQQGNWVPTNNLHHIREGVFHGHPDSLKDCARPEATVSRPPEIPQGIAIPEAARRIPNLVLPAVWFPYRKMGMSATDVALDATGGRFGPFTGQLFVGDFTLSLVMRVWLEKVGGEYQGVCFPFREGFDSAVVRLGWGKDGSMFAGLTNRVWNSLGTRSYGLQRLVWTGKTPFEILTMSSRPDGFVLEFTHPVDPQTAADPASYRMSSYTYLYHETYGSPEIETKELKVAAATAAPDGKSVYLQVEGLREGYVHELHLPGVRSRNAEPLLHPAAYYTLNRVAQAAGRPPRSAR